MDFKASVDYDMIFREAIVIEKGKLNYEDCLKEWISCLKTDLDNFEKIYGTNLHELDLSENDLLSVIQTIRVWLGYYPTV